MLINYQELWETRNLGKLIQVLNESNLNFPVNVTVFLFFKPVFSSQYYNCIANLINISCIQLQFVLTKSWRMAWFNIQPRWLLFPGIIQSIKSNNWLKNVSRTWCIYKAGYTASGQSTDIWKPFWNNSTPKWNILPKSKTIYPADIPNRDLTI